MEESRKNRELREGIKGPKGDKRDSIVGPRPIAGIDYPIPKDGHDGKDAVIPRVPFFRSDSPPDNPLLGDIWIKI